MGQGNGGDHSEQIEAVRTVHVVNGVATSISTDGSTGMLKFTDAAGQEVALTFPLPGGLSVIQNMVFDLATQAKNRAAGMNMLAPRVPLLVNVGHHDAIRNHVLLTFDSGTPHEVLYALPDEHGWTFGSAIRDNILQRKTPVDRARLLSGTAIAGGKIILPGR